MNILRLALLTLLAACPVAQGAEGPALALELPTLAGDRFFRLAELAGQPVLLAFWDTECPACLDDLPLLEETAKKRRVLGISLAPRTQTRYFLDKHPAGYPQLLASGDRTGLMTRFGNPLGLLPHTVMLDGAHRLCARLTGPLTRAWLDAAMEHCR